MLNLNRALAYYISVAIAADLIGYYYVGTAMVAPLLVGMFISNQKLSKNLITVLMPFLLLTAIGAFQFTNTDLPTYGKDFWAYARIPMAMIVGYIFFSRGALSYQNLRLIIIAPSLVYACVQLSHFVVDPSLITKTAAIVRSVAGNGDVYITAGLALSLTSVGRPQRGLWGRVLSRIGTGILLLALFLSFSRALTIFFLVIAYFVFWKKSYWKYILVTGPILIVAAVVSVGALKHDASSAAEGSFAEKLTRIGSEIAISDYGDQQDINLNWRGYESYMALKHYREGDLENYLLGYGFGEMVDVGLFIKLGGEDLRFVPYFHNGYLYLLIKTGAIGLILYLYFIIALFRRCRKSQSNWSRKDPIYVFNGLAQGILIGSIFMTYIITGLFNKGDGLALALVLGGILAVTARASKQVTQESKFAPRTPARTLGREEDGMALAK